MEVSPRRAMGVNPLLVGVFGVLVWEFLMRIVLLPISPGESRVAFSMLGEWALLIFLLSYWLPKVEGLKLESIGLSKFERRYIRVGVLTYLLMFFTMIGAGFIVEALGLDSLRSLGPLLAGYSFPILLGLFVTGTFLEELVFRGYIIERVIMLTNNRKFAAFISWAAFTLVHFRFFGLGPTIETGVMAAFLTGLYLKERSVWPVIVLHGLNGLFAYILVPMFF